MKILKQVGEREDVTVNLEFESRNKQQQKQQKAISKEIHRISKCDHFLFAEVCLKRKNFNFFSIAACASISVHRLESKSGKCVRILLNKCVENRIRKQKHSAKCLVLIFGCFFFFYFGRKTPDNEMRMEKLTKSEKVTLTDDCIYFLVW